MVNSPASELGWSGEVALPLPRSNPTGINTPHNPATDTLHSPAYENGNDSEFRNVGNLNSDAGELPKKEQITQI